MVEQIFVQPGDQVTRRANAGTLVFGRCARGNRTGTGIHAAASSTGQPASGRAGGRSVCLAAGAATAGSSVCRLSTGSSGRQGGCFAGTECAGCCPPVLAEVEGRKPQRPYEDSFGRWRRRNKHDGTGLRGLGSGIRDRAGGCAAGTGGFGSSTKRPRTMQRRRRCPPRKTQRIRVIAPSTITQRKRKNWLSQTKLINRALRFC